MKPVEPGKPTGSIKVGDLVTITGSTYYGGKSIPGWVKKLCWYVVEVSGDRAVINKDESGRYAIMSPVKTSALAVAGTKPSEDYRIHTVVHGDTLWAIAKKYLGNGSRYKEIVSLNGLKSNVIYSGMKLKIPTKRMLSMGILTPSDYAIIDTMQGEKFGISSCSLYRGIDLIYSGFRGNMSHYEEVTKCQEQ